MILILLFCIVLISLLQKEGFNVEYPRKSIDIMYDAKFKPSCCPTPYSTSSGCLCPSPNDAGLIIIRGGNR